MGFSYQVHRLDLSDASFGDFHKVAQSFDTLKPSTYKDGGFRLRRYSRFDYDPSKQALTLKKNSAFVQGDDLNQFQGNVARTYDNLTADTYQSQAFVGLVQDFIKTTNLPAHSEIEVHQMRIVAKDGNTSAAAAPEGIHQDGFDYVGIVTIARSNVLGGELMLWHDKTQAKPIATLSPEAGDVCVVNDQKLWHSASDICLSETGTGHWDLFVFTAHKNHAQQAA